LIWSTSTLAFRIHELLSREKQSYDCFVTLLGKDIVLKENDSKSDTDDETEIQKPKRKRPSVYIAKKDRPENLKSDKKINKLSLDEEICKLSAKRAKLENTSVDSDDAPEKKTFKKFTDDTKQNYYKTTHFQTNLYCFLLLLIYTNCVSEQKCVVRFSDTS
jgi:hypothetical protein